MCENWFGKVQLYKLLIYIFIVLVRVRYAMLYAKPGLIHPDTDSTHSHLEKKNQKQTQIHLII